MKTFRLNLLCSILAGFVLWGCSPRNDNSAPANGANLPGNQVADAPPIVPQPAPSREDQYPYQLLKDLAIVHLKYNNIEEALRLFDLAITRQRQQTNTDDAESWAGLGDALVKAGRKEEAARAYQISLQVYEQVLKANQKPELHNVLVQRILVLHQLLGNEKEFRLWSAELRADENSWAQQVELAAIHEKQKNFDRAEPLYKRALELTAKDPANLAEVELRYGIMLQLAARDKEAEERARAVIKSAEAKDEAKRQARRLLFEIYDKRGELDKLDLK